MSHPPTNAPINRPALTAAMFGFLSEAVNDVKLGRGVAPPAGGWPSGNPRNGAWVPYAVLKTGAAITPAPGFPEGMRTRLSWQCTYQVTSHHVSESEADATAQLLREAAVTWGGEVTLDGVAWMLQEVAVNRLGASERDDSTDPQHWRVTDDVSVRVSRVAPR